MPGDFLLIDNSNSFTKFALAWRDRLGPARKLPTSTLTPNAMRKALGRWRWNAVVLSSVVPEQGRMLEEALADTPLLRVSSSNRSRVVRRPGRFHNTCTWG